MPSRPPSCSSQAEHTTLLEQVQELEALRAENAEMASLVEQLQVGFWVCACACACVYMEEPHTSPETS